MEKKVELKLVLSGDIGDALPDHIAVGGSIRSPTSPRWDKPSASCWLMPTKKLQASKHHQRKQAVAFASCGAAACLANKRRALCQLKARFLSNKHPCCSSM